MAISKELLKKLRNYEIRIRKAVKSQMQGDYHSVFKGSGLEFDDVRTYQYGDDIRHIDWNVSAKGHGTFVKTYKEEKEQNLFFILDVSASQEIGSKGQQKLDICKEICGVLALSAVKEDSSVGMLCFSDQREKYIPPNKGPKHAWFIINTIFNLQPASARTDLNGAMSLALKTIKRKSIFIIVSDFLDDGYQRNLQAIAHRHDLIVVQVADRRETRLPKLGIIPMYDREARKTVWVNTSSRQFRENLNGYFDRGRQALEQLCHRNNANYLFVDTAEDYVPRLIKLFKVRRHHRK